MIREKKDRNKLIMEKIKREEYQVDIANEFGISSAMVSKIKKRYQAKVEELKDNKLKK